jgi:hypothetical protein
VTQQNAALVEQAAAATESMEEQAQNLAQTVSVFKLARHEERAPTPGRVEKRAASVTPLPAKDKTVAGGDAVAEKKTGAPQVRKVANAKAGSDADWEEF